MGNPKGKNWSYEEEVALVEAWMQHSEDRCIGSNQRNMDFWEKVYNHLLKNCPRVVANGRQIGAAIAHFKKIGGATSKYHKCILAAERARTSGQSQIDVVSFASARYQATHPNNRPFGWHHCFVKMQHFVKWQHEPWDTPTDTPTEADDTPTDADADANNNDAKAVQLSANEDASAFQPLGGSCPRPPGRNKSKKARQDSPQAAESINNLCQETKTLFTNHERLIKEHNKYKQRQEDLGIMEMNLTTMFGERRAFWEARQREVMARWNASAANEANQGTSSSGGLYTMKKAAPWNEQVDVISSDDPSSSDVEMEATTENDSKQLTNNVTMDQPTKEITFEDALIRRAEMYEEYMKQIPIPTHHGSVIPFTSWIGLGKSIKQLYGQPLHYLTNILLKQWDLLRIGGEDEYRPLDTIIHPCKAEATIWLIEEVHRRTSSHHHVANLWLSDPMHHAFVDSIFPQLRSKP